MKSAFLAAQKAQFWVVAFCETTQNPEEPTQFNPIEREMFAKENLFAISLFPYLGFLWFLTRSPKVPRLALIGFYATLLFVGITIPAGLYAEQHYGEALANVDWLHGGAEVFLTFANVLVVLGFQQAIARLKKSQNPIQKNP